MGGLAKICKLYGSIQVTGNDGKKALWVYDYANDRPRLKSEMTKEELAASEKAKWVSLKNEAEKVKALIKKLK
jgi:major membrane immunogen (membrane-anchored lipoprotein)